ncbi:MAG: energy-coupling factor transporter transmembrane protein EcfT [Clostridiales bacterium]|nr:energy-coupling factor transporter transmembrane protein EcfT [Candidatus Apopatocola equi]
MLKDVTLGQYFPGDTIVHRLDPRTKLFCVVLYIVEIFTANTVCGVLLSIATLVMAVLLSKTTLRQLMKGMKPLLFIIILTGLLNLFYTTGDTLVKIWFLTITRQGVYKSLQMVSRIIMLICGSFLLTLTTSPLSITDGLERLLNPLKKVGLPVHELSMMMSIALRFIPTLMEETDKIMSAQKARGADFETGSIFRRARALLPVLVPLFVSAFRRADELATAMECRCYHGGEGRTRMKELSMHTRDALCLLLFAALLGAVITLRVLGI